jgi:hypothetical protein
MTLLVTNAFSLSTAPQAFAPSIVKLANLMILSPNDEPTAQPISAAA